MHNLMHCYYIILNNVLSSRSIKNKKNIFTLLSPILFQMLFLFTCWSKLVTYIIFFHSKKLILIFLKLWVYWQKISSIFLPGKMFISSLFWSMISQVQNRLVGFLSSHNCILHFILLVCMVSEEKSSAILIFTPL